MYQVAERYRYTGNIRALLEADQKYYLETIVAD